MVRIRGGSNAGRPRARLLSTPGASYTDPADTVVADDLPLAGVDLPTATEGFTMTSLVANVRFSDQLAALLNHAAAHNFRIEPDERGGGKKPSGVIVYAPDKTVSPITVSERGARFNKAHYENYLRELTRAGMPPIDAPTATAEDEAKIVRVGPIAVANVGSQAEADLLGKRLGIENIVGVDSGRRGKPMAEMLGAEDGSALVGSIVNALAKAGGHGTAEADLAATLTTMVLSWASGVDRISDKANGIHAELEAKYEAQINEALALASASEAEAHRWEEACTKADARAEQVVVDLRAALERAKTAEAELAKIQTAIAPFKALLAGTDV